MTRRPRSFWLMSENPCRQSPDARDVRTTSISVQAPVTCFLSCEPRAGWRHVAITKQRTMQDFAHQMRWLVDEAYPDVPVIRLVLDNLNTHRTASLYETFSPG